MRIAVFGATGRLGLEVVRAALARDFAVTAHRRGASGGAAAAVSGAQWAEDLEAACAGAGAAILTFGPRHPADAPFCAEFTGAILAAARSCRLERLLCVTGAMVGDYPANRTWCFARLTRYIQSRYPALMEDRRRQEETVASSGLAWTIYKPPRLTRGARDASLATGPGVRVGLFSRVARADLADLLVDDALAGRYPRQAVFLKSR
jgi:uncharacterized protein YbjT (DUF2867 family)